MQAWRRTYWAVWAANLVTAVGMMSFLPFFPSLLEELGLEDPDTVALWSGLIFGAAPLSATFMSPVWGSLGDRFGRKLMVVRSMLAISLFVGGMAFATSPVQLFVLRICQGLFSGFIPPSITLVSVAAPPERQGRVTADLQTATAVGAMVGPLLGGFLAASYGHRSVFLFVGAGALIAALLVVFFASEDASQRRDPRVDERVGSSRMGALARGLARDTREVWRNEHVRAAVLLIAFLQFGMGATNPLMELHVRDVLPAQRVDTGFWAGLARLLPGVEVGDEAGLWKLATSFLFGAMALVNLIALPLWGRFGDRVGHRRAMLVCALGSVVALLWQASVASYAPLFAGRMLMGAAMAGIGPLAFGLAASEIVAERRGGAFGVVFSARTLAVAVGGMAGGGLAALIGIRGSMVLAALLVLGALFALRRRPGAEDGEGRQDASTDSSASTRRALSES